jgi:hypothetical protein
VRALLDAVAPGGTLLVGTHHHAEVAHLPEVAECYTLQEIADLLDGDWMVTVFEERARPNAAPEGTHHTRDELLRARLAGRAPD